MRERERKLARFCMRVQCICKNIICVFQYEWKWQYKNPYTTANPFQALTWSRLALTHTDDSKVRQKICRKCTSIDVQIFNARRINIHTHIVWDTCMWRVRCCRFCLFSFFSEISAPYLSSYSTVFNAKYVFNKVQK